MTTSPCRRDRLLFTPGPLSTSPGVRQAMLRDLGARDDEFLALVRDIKTRLLALAGVPEGEYQAVLMQGCGSMGVEAALGSAVPRDGKVLVIANGAYGRRMADMARTMGMSLAVLDYPESTPAHAGDVRHILRGDPAITHVAAVHSETTSGLFNPVDDIGRVVREQGRSFIVDAMSSFGAAAIAIADWHIDWLVSSANKCIEGVPGFSFVIVPERVLDASAGNARSLCLDLHAQHRDMRDTGQFRYTPPTHALLAFHQALVEHQEEGGRVGRMRRYRENNALLRRAMRSLGFREYLAEADQGWIITSYHYPEHPAFDFQRFYTLLREEGKVIYPGKVGDAEVFRIGNIGHIFPSDIHALAEAVGRTLTRMGVDLAPRSYAAGDVA